ncbi:hypothetical protein IW136_005115, partial [Coemansia sp. RSA 678]
MGEVKSLFGADDAELSQLLSQAKQDLARNAVPTTTQASTDRVALTVPFRLATSDRPLLQLDPQTGTARIDPAARHTPLDTNSQPVDPTVRRKSPSELAREKDQTA